MNNIFNNIDHFIVLMLENRSFDHLFGYLYEKDNGIAGLKGNEFNYEDPGNQTSKKVTVSAASNYVMPFDPGHEFEDVQLQLYGEVKPTNTRVISLPIFFHIIRLYIWITCYSQGQDNLYNLLT